MLPGRLVSLDMQRKDRSGFTLIELSIALVIIGLLVGGVLVGQDLIQAAKIRSSTSQIEEYNVSVKLFRLKYNALPGDFSNADAMGITQNDVGIYTSCASRNGNGSRQLNDNSHGSLIRYDGEFFNFWSHLRGAELTDDVNGTYGGTEACQTAIQSGVAGVNYPKARGVGDSIVAVTEYGRLHFIIGGFALARVSADMNVALGNRSLAEFRLTPSEAMQIDQKTDDGKHNSGSVRAFWRFDVDSSIGDKNTGKFAVDIAGGVTGCIDGSSNYNIVNLDQSCTLAIRAH